MKKTTTKQNLSPQRALRKLSNIEHLLTTGKADIETKAGRQAHKDAGHFYRFAVEQGKGELIEAAERIQNAVGECYEAAMGKSYDAEIVSRGREAVGQIRAFAQKTA